MPTFVSFPLPDVGEGLTEADIVEWKVAVGDIVTVNQPLVDIETAKSLVELPSPHAGRVTEVLAAVGDTVEVGTPIITFDVDPDGSGAPAGSTDSTGSTNPVGTGTSADEDETSGDVLVGYGTAKAPATRRARRGAAQSAAQPAGRPAGQSSTQPARPTGTTRPTGSMPPTPATGSTSATGSTPSPAPAATAGTPAPAGPAGQPAPATHPSQPDRATRPGVVHDKLAPPQAVAVEVDEPVHPTGVPVLTKPPVRKLAKDLGVDLTRVRGTGPGDLVTREDVLDAVETSRAERLVVHPEDDRPWLDGGTVSRDGRQTRVPVRSVRRRTAEAMVSSAFSAPHVTVFTTIDVTKTMKLVERLRADREFADVRVTPLLIAAKALILAIRRHPEISAAWDEATQEIVYKHYINLGIAAATNRGLVVPNIKDAHRMSLLELAVALGELTRVARSGRTPVASMQDGTVTITNVGVFGIDTGTPILNPGESAILAFGAVEQRPWVHKGKVKPRWVTQLGLGFDHRLVDGELGSRVLADVAAIMSDPSRGLVWG
ncbi:2-oxo acid dehydrogenase subunit E2 [Pseudactinotalea sp. HY160]|uniref:2-oxo acid dehydrogenase subunit E2 n=1 Tax=Pseudactinotalea sp. HY160 TaxID=2654490 RepID=UPI00128BF33E|nr:2-oxo acid dehydrogenase subunit E2 [Pseudactinotalea sp. HY160]MPV50595.1 2-oxo acid dehydrogenase subunit E2 [Pseudactinotalea sp. HY160]